MEARPAGSGLELRVGLEELRPTARTPVYAWLVLIPVATGERPFGASASQDLVRVRSKVATPLLVRLLDPQAHCAYSRPDVYAIFEFPDNVSAATASVSVAAAQRRAGSSGRAGRAASTGVYFNGPAGRLWDPAIVGLDQIPPLAPEPMMPA